MLLWLNSVVAEFLCGHQGDLVAEEEGRADNRLAVGLEPENSRPLRLNDSDFARTL